MRKILTIMASILIIPSLVFASGECVDLTDDQIRTQLINNPIVIDLNDQGLDGTWSFTFHQDGTLDQRMSFGSPFPLYMGRVVIEIRATWRVTNAILYTHITSARHNDTNNRIVNRLLDEMTYAIMQHPDAQFDMGENTCDFITLNPMKAQRALKAHLAIE